MPMANPLPFASMMATIGRPVIVPRDADEDEGLKHFEQVSLLVICFLWNLHVLGLFSCSL